MRSVRAGSVALAAVLAASGASAALAPGFDTPETLLEGVDETVNFACFLAVAERPWPGITGPLLSKDDEGLKPQPGLPDWLAGLAGRNGPDRLGILETSEGPVWIGYNNARHECIVAVRPADPAAFADELVALMERHSQAWKPVATAGGPRTLETRLKDSASRATWTATIATPADLPGVVLIRMTAANYDPVF